MKDKIRLAPNDHAYPSRLRSTQRPPRTLWSAGGSLEAERSVAIVGSRECAAEAAAFARALAADVARAGAVVVSGGALGVDSAAHRGALDAGGRTWAVAGTGHQNCFPRDNAALFDAIGQGPGAMIWPFSPQFSGAGGFPARNRVLVALADAVVVVQAGRQSGALNAAAQARQQQKPLWVVPLSPWRDAAGFEGSLRLLDQGARPLTSVATLLSSLALTKASPRTSHLEDCAVLRATSSAPLHLDEIASRSGSSAQAASAALLTLALENVVVEGPPGFFRRR